MARQYRSRIVAVTAIDTKTAMTALGSETAPGSLNVPAGYNWLMGIIVVCVANYGAAKAGLGHVLLEGGGLPDGPETCVAGGGGCSENTGKSDCTEAHFIPLLVATTPGNEILLSAEHQGVDVGQLNVGVTLVFGDDSEMML